MRPDVTGDHGWGYRVRVVGMLLVLAITTGVAAQERTRDPRRPTAITATGVPHISAGLVERLRRYQNVRSAFFSGWSPDGKSIAFAVREGRKPVISTFPTGSVPETVLQYWLREEAGIDPDLIEIIHQGTAQVGFRDGPQDNAKDQRGQRIIQFGQQIPHQPDAYQQVEIRNAIVESQCAYRTADQHHRHDTDTTSQSALEESVEP